MPRVRMIVEFYSPKGERYFTAKGVLQQALKHMSMTADDNQVPILRKPTVHNVGNVIGAAITKERQRIAHMAAFDQHTAVTGRFGARDPAISNVPRNPHLEPDYLRRVMDTTPKFGATMEFDSPLPDFLKPGYVAPPPQPLPWWRRLLNAMKFHRGGVVSGTFTGPAPPDGSAPMKISFTGLDRYKK